MGYLAEDRMLFRLEPEARQPRPDEEGGSGSGRAGDPIKAADAAAARKAHLAMKKTIPLYVGLATGFCGSFTSFSSFIRDLFLALSNDLPVPGADAGPVLARSGGQSFLALLAVAVATVALSLSGLFVGAHLAIGLELLTPPLPYPLHAQGRRPLRRAAGVGLLGRCCGVVRRAAQPGLAGARHAGAGVRAPGLPRAVLRLDPPERQGRGLPARHLCRQRARDGCPSACRGT